MTAQEAYILSCYRELTVLKPTHGVYLVQHTESGKIFVKKTLTVYNRAVFQYLKEHPIPNTPRIFEAIEDGETLTVIEEYVTGRTLQEYLEEGTVCSEKQVSDWAGQLCQILKGLHSAKPPIIHRDIKPSNIIVSEEGAVKLLDMNAAKWYDHQERRDTELIGTQGFAAPEQYGFEASSVQTDIYAVGVLMNVLLTGCLPAEELARGKLAPVIRKCVQMEPKKRYHSVEELAAALGARHVEWTGAERFVPPGFHNHSLGKKLLSAAGYGIFLWAGLSLELEGAVSPGALWANRVTIILSGWLVILFSGNYLNVLERLPLTKSRCKPARLLGIVLGDAVIVSLLMLTLVLIEPVL